MSFGRLRETALGGRIQAKYPRHRHARSCRHNRHQTQMRRITSDLPANFSPSPISRVTAHTVHSLIVRCAGVNVLQAMFDVDTSSFRKSALVRELPHAEHHSAGPNGLASSATI
jgi:hypothetical protein